MHFDVLNALLAVPVRALGVRLDIELSCLTSPERACTECELIYLKLSCLTWRSQAVQCVDAKMCRDGAKLCRDGAKLCQNGARSHDITNILNFHMKHLLHDITRITDDIETSIQGDLPLSLITPKQLFSVLSNVSDNLPPGTNLPLSLSNNNLLTFYKHLHTLVIPFENRFHIVIALPLVVNAYQFNLFSALSMPYTPPDLNLTIQYALENSQIAISLNRKHYALISTSESL